ncbi:MAG: polysaccharide export protein [Caulobacteraceae bacterium]|nr:polysaccharide export protein [Caulobacteraceae bacterium]
MFLGVVLLFGVAGCGGGGPLPGTGGPVTMADLQDAPVRTVPEYKLGPADKLRVNVFGEEALTGEFLVGGSGKVSLPLIGEVQAAGLTIAQFQEEIAQALRQGYINEPRVSAEVLNYRPFYILGEVNKPGEYPYTNNLTVLNAVATAEGFTYRADTRRVYIKRTDSSAEQVYPLNAVTQVAPGDTIRIGERFF